MKYIVLSTVVTDSISFPNLKPVRRVLGGAGIYALCGIQLWTDDVLLVSGVGRDFFDLHGKWFLQNHIPTYGLIPVDDHTPFTNIQYHLDGSRTEMAKYGDTHYRMMELGVPVIEKYLQEAEGVYVFRDADVIFWKSMIKAKRYYGFKLEWEINEVSAIPSMLARVRAIAECCDVFSLNYAEAKSLLSITDEAEIIKTLSAWMVPLIYLRNGQKGGMVISKKETIHVPSVEGVETIDPTGAGNSSSAAALFAFCEGMDAATCGIMASISAVECIKQYGPPDIKNIDRAHLTRLINTIKTDYF